MRNPPLTFIQNAAPPRARLPGAGAAAELFAVAHGSTDQRAAAETEALARLARQRAAGGHAAGGHREAVTRREADAGLAAAPLRVTVAYLGHRAPLAADVLAALDPAGPPVVVLPLLLTAAYHSLVDLPALLRERAGAVGPPVSYGRPLGPHPALLLALERRLAEAGVAATPAAAADTAVVLAAAGSSSPDANATIARLAAAWRARRGWHAVTAAFASAAAPTPAQAVRALQRAGARRVVVASYLLAPGYFAGRVRESALAAGADAVSGPLGAAPEVADVLLARYAEAVAEPPAARSASARPRCW